jgi:hypothetical protein
MHCARLAALAPARVGTSNVLFQHTHHQVGAAIERHLLLPHQVRCMSCGSSIALAFPFWLRFCAERSQQERFLEPTKQ